MDKHAPTNNNKAWIFIRFSLYVALEVPLYYGTRWESLRICQALGTGPTRTRRDIETTWATPLDESRSTQYGSLHYLLHTNIQGLNRRNCHCSLNPARLRFPARYQISPGAHPSHRSGRIGPIRQDAAAECLGKRRPPVVRPCYALIWPVAALAVHTCTPRLGSAADALALFTTA